MSEFVQSKINELNAGYRNALASLLPRKDLAKDVDIEKFGQELISRARSADFSPVYRQIIFNPFTTIDDRDIQQMLLEIYADSTALHKQANQVDQFLSRLYEIANSAENDITKSMLRVNEIVLGLLANRANPEYNQVNYISYEQAVNTLHGINAAESDVYTGLAGPRVRTINRFAQKKGPRKPAVEVEVLSAGINDNNHRTFTPDKALDLNRRVFWSDVVLSERLVETTFEGVTYHGPMVVYKIKFPQDVSFNQIKMDQLVSSYLKLTHVRYRYGGNMVDLPGFTATTLEDSTYEVNIRKVHTNELHFHFVQEGWRELNLHIPNSAISTQKVMDLVFRSSVDDIIGNEDTGFDRVNEALAAIGDLNEVIDPTDVKKSARKVFAGITGDPSIVGTVDKLVGDSPVRDEKKIIELKRYEYGFGLRTLEVNLVEYADVSFFQTEKFAPTGSPIVIGLDVVETHAQDSNGRIRDYNIQYDLNISDSRSIPLLPEGTTEVIAEPTPWDSSNRQLTTRFDIGSVNAVYWNGVEVPSSQYSLVVTETNKIYINNGFKEPADAGLFTVDYDLVSAFTNVDLTDIYNSLKPATPEVYSRSQDNKLLLNSNPFVLPDVVFDANRWVRPYKRQSVYQYIPRQGYTEYDPTDSSHDTPVIKLDGEYFGRWTSSLSVDITAVSTTLIFTDNIPPEGVIKIGNELILYKREDIYNPASVNVNKYKTAIVTTRGYKGTTPALVKYGTEAIWQARIEYNPIRVLVNNVEALNLTDYQLGLHEAFQPRDFEDDLHSFVQIGRTLYFNKEVRGKIEVYYRRMVDYLQLTTTFNQRSSGRKLYAGKISSAIIKSQSTVN